MAMTLISRNWRLFRSCVALLRRNPRLLAFPALATAAFLIELLIFGGVALLLLTSTAGTDPDAIAKWLDGHAHAWWMFVPAILPCYVVLNFTIIFFNSALVACALTQLEGGEPTVGGGLRAAWDNRGRILAWSLVTGLVSTLIQWVVSEIPGVAARLVGALGGLAWSLATFFVVPMLVFERTGVVDSITRSAELIKRTWGDQAVMRIGFGAIGVALALIAIVVTGGLIAAGVAVSGTQPHLGLALIVGGMAAFCLGAVVVGLVTQCLELLYSAVLYTYARTGMLPEEIAPELLPPARPR
jgi:hypothetical protein